MSEQDEKDLTKLQSQLEQLTHESKQLRKQLAAELANQQPSAAHRLDPAARADERTDE
jgi:hypothetical protein